MSRTVLVVSSVVLALHGLVHLMGTTVYMKLGQVQGLSYKTTVLGGRWDLGGQGMALFGAAWALAAVGFLAVTVGMWIDGPWWPTLLVGVTLASLVLTALDFDVAFAGVAVNLVILAVALWGPRLS